MNDIKVYNILVYMDDGRVYSYTVEGEDKAREHSMAISEHGYRHNDGKVFEVYPAHRILKVKVEGLVSTRYVDKASGT
jgi:hypothetical protein